MKKYMSERNVYSNYNPDSKPTKKIYTKRLINNEPRRISYYNGKIFKSQIYRPLDQKKKENDIDNENNNQIKTYGLEINKKYAKNTYKREENRNSSKKFFDNYINGKNEENYLKKKTRISLSGKFMDLDNYNYTQENNWKRDKLKLSVKGRLSTNLNTQKVDFKKKFKELKQKICKKINKKIIDKKTNKITSEKELNLKYSKKKKFFEKFDFSLLINKKKKIEKCENSAEKEILSVPSFAETKSSKKKRHFKKKRNKKEELNEILIKKNELIKKEEKKVSKLEMDLTIVEAEKSGLKVSLHNLNEKFKIARKKLRNFKNGNSSEVEIEDLRQKNENNQIKIIKYIKEKEEVERNNEKLRLKNEFLKNKINVLFKIKKEFPFSNFSRISEEFLIVKNDDKIKSALINIFQGEISKKERIFLSELLKEESRKKTMSSNFKKNNLKSVRNYNYVINDKKNNTNKINDDEYYGDLSYYDSKTEKKSEILNKLSQKKKFFNDEKSSLLDLDISVKKNNVFFIKKRCFDQNSKNEKEINKGGRNKSLDFKKFNNNFRKSVGANKNDNEDVYHSIIQNLKTKIKKLKKKDCSRRVLKKKKRNLSQQREF